MADENQNTEMEDILSSIKNILEEDNGGQSSDTAAIPAAENDIVDDLLSSTPEVDDILELSPDMRIEQDAPPAAEAESVDVSLPELENDIADTLNIGIEDEISDSVFDDALDVSAEIEHPLDVNSEQTEKSDPIVETLNTVEENTAAAIDGNAVVEQISVDEYLESPIDSSNIQEPDFVIEPATEVASEVSDYAEQQDTAPVIETEIMPVSAVTADEISITDAIVEETNNTSPIIEDLVESVSDSEEITEASETETVVEEQETAAAIEEPVANIPENNEKPDAADVSAGIISNFAKMFAKEEPVAPAAIDEALAITAPGNTGKTLEEFVLESISKVIGAEISRQWNDGAAFKMLAETEINRQTREWINDNLPALVEKVVKQEIERVIAKVGS